MPVAATGTLARRRAAVYTPPVLPVDPVLPQLLAHLERERVCVLVAPPGAGKTTRVPPALLAAPWAERGRILVLEPRRLAARAACARMAAERGEGMGATIGFRVRLETRVSAATRVEIVTPGVFVRMILDDPALSGVAAVIFDEAHERALDADLALALALDARAGLREDLRLLVMSATLDGARIAALLGGAPIVTAEGRAYSVETLYLGADPALPVEERVARAVRVAIAEEDGSVLAFLPGQAEIARTVERLSGRLPADVDLAPLYGALSPREQDAAIRPAPAGRRKVVLATAIAETSLTIEGIRVVVDAGLSRRPRYDPGSGLTRLETVRASQAAVEQRRGRAGRTQPGICYRLWDAPQTMSLPPFDRPEILESDLSGLALNLLAWAVADPAQLAWLDPPPAAAYAEALDTLGRLGSRAGAAGLSEHGKRMAALPLPPRLSHMLLKAAEAGAAGTAAEISAILTEPGLGGRSIDLASRLEAFRVSRGDKPAAARKAAARWARHAIDLCGRDRSGDAALAPGALLALAFPERLAQARGTAGRFRLASGRGAYLDEAEPLAREPFLAVGEVQGGGADARVSLAGRIDRETIRALFPDRIVTERRVRYDAEADLLRATEVERLDALVLSERAGEPASDEAARLLAKAALARGFDRLPWPDDLSALRGRIAWLRHREGEAWPDLADEALVHAADDWLVPAFAGKRRLAELSADDLRRAFGFLLPWHRLAEAERRAPSRWTAPSGRALAVEYSSGEPVARGRAQDLFGLAEHPKIAGVPIVFELLSPAGRPIQVTRDLPGFWRGSWREVRAAMRGRYPKHAWPEDPLHAMPQAGVRRPTESGMKRA